MDPDVLLKELLTITRRLDKKFETHGYVDGGIKRHDIEEMSLLCEKVLDLDSWLKNGGFIPSRWA